MPSSPPSPFVLRALPTLPAEVLTAILEDPRLSKRDLSNCCLVNKHFTALAQPLLFRHLRLWCGHSAVSIDEEPGYVLHEDTKLLFRALRDLRNSHLCQYPRKLSVATYGADQEWIVNSDEEDDDSDIEEGDEDRGHYGFTGEFDDPSTPLKRALRLMPQVCSIDVGELAWASKLVRNVVFRHGQRWKEIEVDGCLLTEGADEREWSTLPSLQKVVCSELQRGGSPIRPLPRGLRTLNTPFVPPPIEDDSPPIESQLRVLSASLSVYTLLRIPAYRHLQFLYLWSIWGDSSISSPSTISDFSTLPALRILSIRLEEVSSSVFTVVAAILRHLPPALLRLEFPSDIPFDELNTFLRSTGSVKPRILRLHKGHALARLDSEKSNALTAICREEEIKIEHLVSGQSFRCLPSIAYLSLIYPTLLPDYD